MKVTAIANENNRDDFAIDFKIGEEIIGEAKRYSQNYIWLEFWKDNRKDQTIDFEDDDILYVKTKVKIVKGTIKRLKCNYCENYDKGNGTCKSEDCLYEQEKESECQDYSLVQDYSCGGL
jgi:hypothetical protein